MQPDTADALFGQSNQQQRRAVPYRWVSEGQCSALLLCTQAHAHIQDDSPVTNLRLGIFSRSVVVKLMHQPTGRAPGDAAVWGEEWRDQTVEISDRIGARMRAWAAHTNTANIRHITTHFWSSYHPPSGQSYNAAWQTLQRTEREEHPGYRVLLMFTLHLLHLRPLDSVMMIMMIDVLNPQTSLFISWQVLIMFRIYFREQIINNNLFIWYKFLLLTKLGY